MDYPDLIDQFFYEAVPTADVSPSTQFEAVSSSVFGTKQRRQGPMPSAEVQVAVRDVLRHGDPVRFLVPWASSKQDDGPLDILEFMALKQLRSLAEEQRAFGRQPVFVFRVEDLTDRFLFGDGRIDQITTYRDAFSTLAAKVVGDVAQVRAVSESFLVGKDNFLSLANELLPVFYRYLTEDAQPDTLEKIGWKGTIPKQQRLYYTEAFARLYPGEDPDLQLAKYFAATLARNKLRATAAPDAPAVQVSFAKPVPGAPPTGARVHFRTLPAKYTHHHQAPWMARGYLACGEDNRVVPRFREPGVEVLPHTQVFQGVPVYAPYAAE